MISGVSSYSSYSRYSSTLASTQRNSAAQAGSSGGAGGPAKLQEKLFKILDSNGDGSVAKDELDTALTAAKQSDNSLSIDIDDLFSQLDANSDGSIDQQETAALAPPPPPPGGLGGGGAQDMFSQLDSNSDGSVGIDELGSALGVSSDDSQLKSLFGDLDSAAESAALGGPPPPPPPAQGSQSEDSDSLFSALDSDGNGSVSKSELSSLFDALKNSGKTQAQSEDSSGYASLVASLLKQYSDNANYSSSLGSQLSLSA